MPKPIINSKEQLKYLIDNYDKKGMCLITTNGIVVDKENKETYEDFLDDLLDYNIKESELIEKYKNKDKKKCKDCNSCVLGFFKSKPEKFVCLGVKNPFVIEDINKYCAEY